MYLYKLYNTITEKGYIGITIRPVKKRLAEHFNVAKRGRSTLIARALAKYGMEAFTLTILGQAESWDELCAMEREAIMLHQTFKPDGYNLTRGGEGTLGRLHTEEAKTAISTKNTGKVHDQAFRDAVSARMKGVPKSPAQRAKMGEWQRGENNSQFGKTPTHHAKMLEAAAAARERDGHPTAGRPLSNEHKAKMSVALKGRKLSEAEIEQRRISATGRTHSEETRAKIRAATRRQFAFQGNPMQGRKHSDASKQLMAEKRKGKAGHLAEHNRGRALSPEHRQRLSEVRKGQVAWNKGLPWHEMTGGKLHPKSRSVEYNGVIYDSVMACHKATGIARTTIREYIKKGKARYVKD